MKHRNFGRVCAASILEDCRVCDLRVEGKGDFDVRIVNISQGGMCLMREDASIPLAIGDRVFILGCIFSDLIGILSSHMGTIAWTEAKCFGVRFDEPLEMDEAEMQAAALRPPAW